MSEIDLETIKKREMAATKGPWGCDDGHIFSRPMFNARIEFLNNKRNGERPPNESVADCSQNYENFEADSEFIAHARQDIPALRDEVERLRARVKELEGEPCNWTEDENGNWNTDCGNCFVLEAETPCENEMKFCAYCGKTLTETRFAHDDEEGEANHEH